MFSWLGHISGAVSMMGRVVLLDSYIPRLEVTPGRTPFVIKDMVDLKPEAIFIGHGHSDHADNAVFIAAKTGATLYMTPEACGTAQTALARMKADTFMQADPFYAIAPATTITCVPITTAGSTPGTQVIRINQLEPLVCINAFRALHSVSVPADPDWGPVPVVDTPDPRDATLFPAGVPLTPTTPRQPGQQDLRQGNGPGGADELNFHFTVRGGYNFTLLFNNSVGAMKEGLGSNWPNGTPADGQRLLDLVRNLPNTDLNFATLSSGNTDNNGWRDAVYWAQAVRPKIMTTGHAPVGAVVAVLRRLPEPPEADGAAEERVAGVPARAMADRAQPHRPDRRAEAGGLHERRSGVAEPAEGGQDRPVLLVKRAPSPRRVHPRGFRSGGAACGFAMTPAPRSFRPPAAAVPEYAE